MSEKKAGAAADEAVAAAASGKPAPVKDREEEDPYLPGTPLEMQGPDHSRRLDHDDTESFGVDRTDTFAPATSRQDNLQPVNTGKNIGDEATEEQQSRAAVPPPPSNKNVARTPEDTDKKSKTASDDRG
jgi:hypothetical protein